MSTQLPGIGKNIYYYFYVDKKDVVDQATAKFRKIIILRTNLFEWQLHEVEEHFVEIPPQKNAQKR